MDGMHTENPLSNTFPLSALVGGQTVSDALACGLCSDDIHTILIVGPPGTGKSVAARGIAGITDKAIVELPSNATREQVFGSIDLEAAFLSGVRVVGDSIMRRAHNNILIADNINLLPAGTLQSVLNYVHDGQISSEMEGVSLREVCDTLLIGTMDPSDGTLSDHLLDRFDICVFMEGLPEESDRYEVIRRRLEYERNPESFCGKYSDSLKILKERIGRADPHSVKITNDYPSFVSEICASMNVQGHRGDIAVLNTACALAALGGRDTAGMQDLKKAVEICLQHRRREENVPQPQEQPVPPEQPEQQKPPETPDDTPRNNEEDRQSEPKGRPLEVDSSDPDENQDGTDAEGEERIFGVGEEFKVTDYIPPESRSNKNSRSGRQDISISKDGTGRTVGYMIPFGKPRDISLTASLFVAAPKQKYRQGNGLAITMKKEDLREKVRVRNKGTEVLFVVDGSGSMGAHSRMVAVKGAILSMLDDAYKKRDQVGLVVFRNNDAREILPLTRSVLNAYRTLQDIPTGGKTPLNAGLRMGYEILKRSADSGNEPVMVVLTDGRGNVATNGNNVKKELTKIVEVLSDSKIRTIIVDTETGLVLFGKARALAESLDATYMKLEELNAEYLSASIKTALQAISG